MADAERTGADAPMVVHTHVTPWGFLVALPLALAFAYLGAWSLDADIVPHRLGSLEDPPIWLFSAFLIAFSLFLFLIGVGELARYLKPTIEVVIDQHGVTTFGVLGKRRAAWSDLVDASIDQGQLALRCRAKGRGAARDVRLHFNRLAVEPAALISKIGQHRPDLATVTRAG